MFSGNDSLPTAVITEQEHDLKPLLEESIEVLELDDEQVAAMERYLYKTWFFGVKTGHRVMAEAKLGQSEATAVILGMQNELQDLMERLAEDLNTTIGDTVSAWNFLGRAWIAGSKFWEVEIAARLIESKAGGFDEMLGQ